MGILILKFLPKISVILINGIVKLSKLFARHLKKAKNMEHKEDDEMSSQSDNEEDSQDENQEFIDENSMVYKNISRQVKDCQRKSLGILKDIYKKFNHENTFVVDLSKIVYDEILVE